MKLKYAFTALLAAVLLSSNVQAQATAKEAKALLQQASAKLKSYKTYAIDFDYTFENTRVKPPVKQEQQGNLAVKGEDYRLNFMDTEQLRVGDKLYLILTGDEEIQVTAYDEEDNQGFTPSRILNLYNKGYSYKLGGKETINGKSIEYVILKPNASEEIDKIMVGIDKSTSHIHSLKQWGKNGTITTFTVRNFSPNPTLPTGHFSFNKADYPGFYIAE